MNYIIFDLEWNQPLVPKKRVKGLHGEIIQIGAIKVDEDLNEIDNINLLIHPQFYHKMNRDIGELTGITQEMIDSSSLIFPEAIDRFKEWIGEDSVLISWSFSDISILENNLEKFGLDSSWIPECYDAQMMFDYQEMDEERNYALNYALYHYNEKPDSSHDALDDARSTLKVMRHLDLEEGITEEYSWSYTFEEYDDWEEIE